MIVGNNPTFDRHVVPSKPSHMSHNLDPSAYAIILVPRARRFLVTWSTNRIQIKPSCSGDENVTQSDFMA